MGSQNLSVGCLIDRILLNGSKNRNQRMGT